MKYPLLTLFLLLATRIATGQEYQLIVEPSNGLGKSFSFQENSGIILFLKDSTAKRVYGKIEALSPEYVTVGRPLLSKSRTVAWEDVDLVAVRNPWHTAFRYLGAPPMALGAITVPIATFFLIQALDSDDGSLLVVVSGLALAVAVPYGLIGSIPFFIPRRRLPTDTYTYRFEVLE